MGICHIKVRIFWEDHEKWKMGQIFVPFSEYLNFTLENFSFLNDNSNQAPGYGNVHK